MDKGAHFYRCDFQVHTPRDINWHGDRAATDEERRQYANDFILECRRLELDAAAITDHHDLAFFPYIKEAALNECDENGRPISEDKRIVIFPGMELTLGIPCQAILILDADFPQDQLSVVLAAFAINAAPASEERHAPVVQLQNITSFQELYSRLNEHSVIKDRFIVLPNVSEGGNSTLLRSRFAGHYKDMPCVGGYLDGSIDKLGAGNTQILAGKNREYGFKKLGLFQTSDSRSRDLAHLASHSTWVKWSEPTAEALRQACLAGESRISQTKPTIPAVYVTSVQVSSSKFMGHIDCEFNPQFNALIGGRGTGKSTILEYLRWALCDQPPAISGDDNMPDYQNRRLGLITGTLKPFDGKVEVSFLVNGITHIVRRSSASEEMLLKIGNDEFRECTESELRRLLPIVAFSQKQLSIVGIREDELQRFVYTPIDNELAKFHEQITDVTSRIRVSYQELQRMRRLEKEMTDSDVESQSIAKQVDALKKELKGLSKADQEILALKDKYDAEEEIIATWSDELSKTFDAIELLQARIKDFPSEYEIEKSYPNAALLDQLQISLVTIFSKLKDALPATVETIANLSKPSEDDKGLFVFAPWVAKRDSFAEQYEQAKNRSSAQKQQLAQISSLEVRQKEIKSSIAEKKKLIGVCRATTSDYDTHREAFFNLHRKRADLIEEQTALLTTLSDNNIRAVLRRGVLTVPIEEALRNLLAGTKTRSAKLDKVVDEIRQANDQIVKWNGLLKDFELLANAASGDVNAKGLPHTPVLDGYGFIESEKLRIVEKLTPEAWLDLSLLPLDDVPTFEYRSKEGQYIPFRDASAGQQATSLLATLLNQEGPPLIIDQPEDDLDNRVIVEIVEKVWAAKRKRQLIFSSHNANLVVNGDAELVVYCDYRISTDQAYGEIKATGAIDNADIRKAITQVMEGGKDAFNLRKQKYGF